MVRLSLILLLLVSRLSAQLAAPDLRCLEVLLNGSVKLTWLAPADPNGLFFSYQIFSSNSAAGPFTQITTIGAINTVTFVHPANANNTSQYYFIRALSGSSGSQISENSDTLRTIFLNVIPAAVDLKLVYNHLLQPKLPTSSTTFTVNKEYPKGIWNIFGITDKINFQDTLIVCEDSMSYQITLGDAAGCVSASNTQRGEYKDQKPPNEPYVDSISVLPNGQTVLAWRVPRDIDIELYRILNQPPGGPNNYIDSVTGRPSTIYTYTVLDALNQPVKLFVAAEDSCPNISTFDDEPTTIYVQAYYDVCAYQTKLSWNEYKGMHKGVKEYRIYYSVNGGAFNRIGTSNTNTFTHEQANPGKTLCYFVRVINTDETITASSNRTCFFSKQVRSPAFVYLKKVSALNEKSIDVHVYLDSTIGISGLDVRRSNNDLDYTNIGFLSFNGTSSYSFIDTNAEPVKQSYYYKIFLRDSCNNIRMNSNVAKTILLRVKQDENMLFTQHLSWTDYLGFGGGVSGYNIYRIINNELDRSPIGFADAQTTNFVDDVENAAADGSSIQYMIEAVEGITNPYGLLEKSNSNSETVYIEGRLFVPNAFAPDGTNKTWKPITHFISKTEYMVRVFDRWGGKVFETTNDTDTWDGANLPAGVFVYLISYKNSRGEYQEAKGTVNLIR